MAQQRALVVFLTHFGDLGSWGKGAEAGPSDPHPVLLVRLILRKIEEEWGTLTEIEGKLGGEERGVGSLMAVDLPPSPLSLSHTHTHTTALRMSAHNTHVAFTHACIHV